MVLVYETRMMFPPCTVLPQLRLRTLVSLTYCSRTYCSLGLKYCSYRSTRPTPSVTSVLPLPPLRRILGDGAYLPVSAWRNR